MQVYQVRIIKYEEQNATQAKAMVCLSENFLIEDFLPFI